MKQISKTARIRIPGIAETYRALRGAPLEQQLAAAINPERPLGNIEEITPPARTPLRTARRSKR